MSGVPRSSITRMKVRRHPAANPGSMSGSVTFLNRRNPWLPVLWAASSSAGSMFAKDTLVFSMMNGK